MSEKKNFDFLQSIVIPSVASVPYTLRIRLFIKNHSARKMLSIDIYYDEFWRKNIFSDHEVTSYVTRQQGVW